MRKSSDLIRVWEAAEIAGKSVRTIKRWVKEGKLADMRGGDGSYAPLVVSRSEVIGFVSDTRSPIKRSVRQMSGLELEGLRMLVEELRRDKRELQVEVRQYREELQGLRAELNRRGRQGELAL